MTIIYDITSTWSSENALKVFSRFSSQAALEAPELHIKQPHHIFREDLPKCLERISNRPLSVEELAAVQKSFSLDSSALISWEEFEKSLTAMRTTLQSANVSRATTNSRARLLAARRKGISLSQSLSTIHGKTIQKGDNGDDAEQKRQKTSSLPPLLVPLTSSQEVGWYAHNNNSAGINNTTMNTPHETNIHSKGEQSSPFITRKYCPLQGTDVTRGKEGRSLETYYGAHLGKFY